MEHEYQIGDVVQLTEGSVDMTVLNISASDVTTQFKAVGSGETTTARFHHQRVKLIRKSETSVEAIAETTGDDTTGEGAGDTTGEGTGDATGDAGAATGDAADATDGDGSTKKKRGKKN